MGHQCNDVGDCAAADREDEGVGHWRVISGVFAGAPTLAVHEDEGGEAAGGSGLLDPFAVKFAWENHFGTVMNLCGIWRKGVASIIESSRAQMCTWNDKQSTWPVTNGYSHADKRLRIAALDKQWLDGTFITMSLTHTM